MINSYSQNIGVGKIFYNKPQIVYLDTNMIDRFVEAGLDPINLLQNSEYSLAITNDVRREIECMIEKSKKKIDLESKKKIDLGKRILDNCPSRSYFGYSDPDDSAPQRCGGYDEGIWQSQQSSDFLDSHCSKEGKIGPTGIPKKRTDYDLASLSADYWVITDNSGEAHWKVAGRQFLYLVQWSQLKEILKNNNGDLIAAFDSIYQERNKDYE